MLSFPFVRLLVAGIRTRGQFIGIALDRLDITRVAQRISDHSVASGSPMRIKEVQHGGTFEQNIWLPNRAQDGRFRIELKRPSCSKTS